MTRRTITRALRARTLDYSLLAIAFGVAGCSGDPSGNEDQLLADAEARPVLLDTGSISVELSSLDIATGRILYTVRNDSQRSVRLLQRDTALQVVSMNMFDVRRAGQLVPFVGTHVYWGEPSARDYLEVPAGSIVEGIVDLPASYEMREPGEYTVQARPRSVAIAGTTPDQTTSVLVAASPPAVVHIDGTHRRAAPIPKFRNFAEDCTAGELADMVTGESEALDLARAAVSHLNNMPFVGDPGGRYERWFGDPERDFTDVRRAESVLTQALRPGAGLPDMQFSCRDDGDVVFVDSAGNDVGCGTSLDREMVAATNGSLGTTVHVCPSFLTATTRRMASVMIHEASHHYGTDDFVSNPTDALNLAITDPDSAVESAENYEQYVLEF